MVERIARRRHYAYLLKDSLGLRKFLSFNDDLASRCLALATADPSIFEESFQEPMPAHLAKALRLEIEAWADLKVAIEHLRAADLTMDDYKTTITKLRERFTPLIALLFIQEDILASPLTTTFEHRIKEAAGQ